MGTDEIPMSRESEKDHNERLPERVSEILHFVWDPIGVAGVPQARDEYDSYVPFVVKMIMEGKPKEDIARHLHQIAGERMGLSVGLHPSNHTGEVAETLIEHWEWLKWH